MAKTQTMAARHGAALAKLTKDQREAFALWLRAAAVVERDANQVYAASVLFSLSNEWLK